MAPTEAVKSPFKWKTSAFEIQICVCGSVFTGLSFTLSYNKPPHPEESSKIQVGKKSAHQGVIVAWKTLIFCCFKGTEETTKDSLSSRDNISFLCQPWMAPVSGRVFADEAIIPQPGSAKMLMSSFISVCIFLLIFSARRRQGGMFRF